LESEWAGDFRENLGRVYRAIREQTQSRVVVDASKLPLYGYALGTVPEIDLYVVHVVRDPRAVVYSWRRKKPNPGMKGAGVLMPQRGPTRNSLEWDLCNAATEAFWGRSPQRYLRLRYEDLVEEPRASVKRMLDLVGEGGAPLPFVSERGVEFGPNHNVRGNPNRFQTGTVELRPDREWAGRIGRKDRAVATALTLPLLGRYGYPINLPRG
jgi:hypothetical protein